MPVKLFNFFKVSDSRYFFFFLITALIPFFNEITVNSTRNQFCKMLTILHFGFRNWQCSNFKWLIRFQCVVPDSAVFLKKFSNFPQIKEGGTSYLGWNQFCKMAKLFPPPWFSSVFHNFQKYRKLKRGNLESWRS